MKRVKITSEDTLMKQGLNYLERYPCTTTRMARYLREKLEKLVKAEDLTAAECAPWTDAVIARMVRVDLLNDTRYAESRARGLARKGKSQRAIRRDLWIKKLTDSEIAAALASLAEDADGVDPELIAAVNLARRRRLGPYSAPEVRVERYKRHLASMARSGFQFGMARRVLDAKTVDDAEALVAPDGVDDGRGLRGL